MSKVIVFAGTTEGREIAAFLKKYDISALIFTATEYGKCVIEEGGSIRVESGRLDQEAMEFVFRKELPEVVIDATHPYASLVSDNIKNACRNAGAEYQRLLRPSIQTDASCILVENVEEAVDYLTHHEGNVLVTTGSKELSSFTAVPGFEERLYARVLPTASVVAACQEMGFNAGHLIAMQGPFSEEMNTAMLKAVGASYLVTKESGKNGGFEEKVRAAKKAGAAAVVIGRPVKEEGKSEGAIKKYLAEKFRIAVKRDIVIAGIGMGTSGQMTGEVLAACRDADVLIGAERMLEAASSLHKPVYCAYHPQKIVSFVKEHPEYERIVLLQSGDVGFYSGARRLLAAFEGEQVQIMPGISSVVYLCARLGTAWEDAHLISLHGRDANFVDAVRHHRKVFALAGSGESVQNVCEKLLHYGMNQVKITVGAHLSYPEEMIVSGTPEELLDREFDSLCVFLLENTKADSRRTIGIADEAFLRGKVPMTKREVRCTSLSHLALSPDSIGYDIGAGTGSVSVEMALQAYRGKVYAIEKNPEAVELIRQNKRKFCADNLEILEGYAPEALRELPAPTHAFIGGSSGNLSEILELLLEKNPTVRVVINTVTLETLAETLSCLERLSFSEPEVVCIQAAGAKKAGRFHLMMGQNPVYIFTADGGGRK